MAVKTQKDVDNGKGVKTQKGAKTKPKRPPGRPSLFSDALAGEICGRIAAGESLNRICKDQHMPDQVTIYRWLASNEQFRKMYAQSREDQAETLADEIVSIADEECTMVRADKHGTKADDDDGNTEVVFDATAVARNRLRVDARKWVAAKLKPRKYGEKVDLNHGGQADNPLTMLLGEVAGRVLGPKKAK